ncbi:hypothetical protein LguiB_032591 [Lonicera macranthoides]
MEYANKMYYSNQLLLSSQDFQTQPVNLLDQLQFSASLDCTFKSSPSSSSLGYSFSSSSLPPPTVVPPTFGLFPTEPSKKTTPATDLSSWVIQSARNVDLFFLDPILMQKSIMIDSNQGENILSVPPSECSPTPTSTPTSAPVVTLRNDKSFLGKFKNLLFVLFLMAPIVRSTILVI